MGFLFFGWGGEGGVAYGFEKREGGSQGEGGGRGRGRVCWEEGRGGGGGAVVEG